MYRHLYKHVISRLPERLVEKSGGVVMAVLSHLGSPPSPLPFSVAGLTFPQPVGIPSGWVDTPGKIRTARRLGAGVVTIKTVTLEEKKGNPYPRIIRGDDHLINSMGLPNRGYRWWKEYALSHEIDGPVFLSIKGGDLDEWRTLLQENDSWVDAYEINLSCPNVSSGIMDIERSITLIKEITSYSRRPMWVKLSPEFSPSENLELVREVRGHVSGVTLINTVPVDEPRVGNPLKRAGKSGPAIYPVLLSFLKEFRREFPTFGELPIFATGGIDAQNCLDVLFTYRAIPLVLTNFLTQSPFIYRDMIHRIQNELSSLSLTLSDLLK